MKRLNLMIAGAIALIAADAQAQDFESYQRRQTDLIAISAIFGELHHIRRLCEPRLEADAWRERMKKLIELEDPQPAARDEMVSSFNTAYRGAQRRFPGCDRRARDYAAQRAAAGDVIVARLTAPLYEATAEDGELPMVWRGRDGLANRTTPNQDNVDP